MQRADATLGVARVEDVTRHGIITPDGNRIVDNVEKPAREEAASDLGSMGMYVFEREIFDAIKRTEQGYNGEYQLTDSVRLFAVEGRQVLFKLIDGIHIDVGTPKDLMKANKLYLNNEL